MMGLDMSAFGQSIVVNEKKRIKNMVWKARHALQVLLSLRAIVWVTGPSATVVNVDWDRIGGDVYDSRTGTRHQQLNWMSNLFACWPILRPFKMVSFPHLTPEGGPGQCIPFHLVMGLGKVSSRGLGPLEQSLGRSASPDANNRPRHMVALLESS